MYGAGGFKQMRHDAPQMVRLTAAHNICCRTSTVLITASSSFKQQQPRDLLLSPACGVQRLEGWISSGDDPSCRYLM